MKKLIIIIIFLFIARASFAQFEFHPGSPYSAFGFGELKYNASIRTDNMGIQGISLFGNYVNNLNPAVNTYLRNTNVSIGAKAWFLNSSNNNSEIKVSDTYIAGFNFGIPIWNRNGLVLLLGFNPYSQIQYKIVGSVHEPSGTSYTETFAGQGGLSRLNFGVAGRPLNYLSLGFEYDYIFGNVKSLTFFDFNNSGMTNTYYRSEADLKGYYLKGGAVLDFGALFPRNNFFDKLTIGAFYQNKFTVSSKLDRIYTTSLIYNDTLSLEQNDYKLPESFGFGITKQIGKQLIISSDILFQKWGNFTSEVLTPKTYNDNFRYGIGFEVLPSPKRDRSAFESLTYRAGFSYDKSYYKINGEFINNYAVNFGIGIPLNNENAVDLGLELGTKGTKDNGLAKDNYLKVSLGLNFGEFWFMRPGDEDR